MYELCHEIHTSERKSFRACRRRWDWVFRGRYYPYGTAKPLEFGIAYHKAMEVWYNPDTWKMPRDVIAALAIDTFVQTCEEQRAAYLKQQAVPYVEDDVQADYDERVELGKGMLNYYFTEVSPKRDHGFTPVKVEVTFKVPIMNPETGQPLYCKCDECQQKIDAYFAKAYPYGPGDRDPLPHEEEMYYLGLPVVYAGRIDMLAQDEEGDYWIFDWKTAATIRDDMDQHLDLDDQITSYVWALRLCNIPVRGFIYVEQWKNFPKPPKRNLNVRKGCSFSVSKSEPVQYEMYLRTIQREDEDAYKAGYYDEFLDWLQEFGPKYDMRYQKYRSEQELYNAGMMIGLEALDMIDPKLRIYPNPGRFGCSTCAFRTPCMGKNMGEDVQYTLDTLYEKREHHYYEVAPSTESKGGE